MSEKQLPMLYREYVKEMCKIHVYDSKSRTVNVSATLNCILRSLPNPLHRPDYCCKYFFDLPPNQFIEDCKSDLPFRNMTIRDMGPVRKKVFSDLVLLDESMKVFYKVFSDFLSPVTYGYA